MKLPSKPYKHKEQYAAILALYQTIDQLIDYLAEREEKKVCLNCGKGLLAKRKITLPKPEWWDTAYTTSGREKYLEALSDTSKASGILFKLED